MDSPAKVMQTTLHLPDHLMQQLKQRALQQGRPIKDLVADTIRQGLDGAPGTALQPSARVVQENFFLDGPGVSDDFLAERADQEQAEREAF